MIVCGERYMNARMKEKSRERDGQDWKVANERVMLLMS